MIRRIMPDWRTVKVGQKLFIPTDGYVSPHSVACNVLNAARRNFVRVGTATTENGVWVEVLEILNSTEPKAA